MNIFFNIQINQFEHLTLFWYQNLYLGKFFNISTESFFPFNKKWQESFPDQIIRVAYIHVKFSVNISIIVKFFVFFSYLQESWVALNCGISFSPRYYFTKVLSCFPFRSLGCRHFLIYYAHIMVLLYLREFITYSARSASLCFRNTST